MDAGLTLKVFLTQVCHPPPLSFVKIMYTVFWSLDRVCWWSSCTQCWGTRAYRSAWSPRREPTPCPPRTCSRMVVSPWISTTSMQRSVASKAPQLPLLMKYVSTVNFYLYILIFFMTSGSLSITILMGNKGLYFKWRSYKVIGRGYCVEYFLLISFSIA